MSKIKSLFNFLTFGTFLSVIILFIADFFGFFLNINFNIFSRILAALLFLALLINVREIKNVFIGLKDFKKFIFLSLINLLLISLFLLFYPIFRFGSPLVWEDRIVNFRTTQKIEINLDKTLKQTFQAKSNNLGTIGLRIISKDIVIEEEEEGEEETINTGLEEDGEAGLIREMNTEGEGEFDEEIFFSEPERIVFRIKEDKKEIKDYFYENTYELNQDWGTDYFLFGFPIQGDSKDKNYVFEIEKIEEGETGKTFLIEQNSDNNFDFYPRYVYSLKEIKSDYNPIFSNISRKTNQFLEEKSNQSNLIFTFLLVEFFIFCFLKREEKHFKEKIIPCLEYGFLIGLLLIIISSSKFVFVKQPVYLQNIIDSLSGYNLYLILLTLSFGFFAYFRKEKINGEVKKESESRKSLSFDKWNLLIIIILLICGFLLRIWNLGKLGFVTDEASTAQYAYYINKIGLPCSDGICYLRGLPYLYFVSIFTKLFGVTEFWVRFPGVIVGILTIMVLIWFLRKLNINKKVILLTTFLLVFSDWHIMLSRYARMYGMMLLFMILAFIFLIEFIEKNKGVKLIYSFIFVILALLTHQFAMLLVFLVFFPWFFRKNNYYKDKRFLFFIILVFLSIFLALTKLPGYIYDHNYFGFYDFYPEYLGVDKWWFLQNIQLPNFIYIENMFMYFPVISIFTSLFIISNLFKPRKEFLIGGFILFSFIVFSIYKIDYILKYLWWILALIIPVFSLSIYPFLKDRKIVFLIVILIVLIPSQFGIYHILMSDYGKGQKDFPTITPSHTEDYYADDKTPIIFLTRFYKEGDIIIYDYWIQNIYLQLLLKKQADYTVSRRTIEETIQKFPMYKFYRGGNVWQITKDGPVIISSLHELLEILDENKTKNVWYISGADFEGRKYLYISQKTIDNYIRENYSNNIIYIGKDNNSRLYLLNHI